MVPQEEGQECGTSGERSGVVPFREEDHKRSTLGGRPGGGTHQSESDLDFYQFPRCKDKVCDFVPYNI